MGKDTQILNKYEFVQLLFNAVSSIDKHENADASESSSAAKSLHNLIDKLLQVQAQTTDHNKAIPSMLSLLKSQPQDLSAEFSEGLLNIVNLIDKLFDYMLKDKHLQPHIKTLIGRLRVPFFKLAITDKTLFVESQHPARLFFNDITRVALLWTPNDPKTFMIEEQLSNTIQQIITASPKHPEISDLFNTVSQQFNQFSAGLIKRTEIFEKRIKESEIGKAKAEQAKQWAKQTLNQITIKKNIPSFVLNAFNKAWEHVIFLERLKDIKEEQGQSLLTAKQLLVSLQPIKSEHEIEKAIELQPILIERIKSGLDKTSFSFNDAARFLERLIRLHKDILTDAQSIVDNSGKEEILRLKPTTSFKLNAADIIPAPQKTELAVKDMSLSQWVENTFNALPDDPQNIILTDTQAKTNDDSADQELFNSLKPGSWFELKVDDETIRCKFASYVNQNDKYLFVSGSGSKVAEFNTESLAKAFQNKQIETLDNSPIFDRAYDLIADEVVAEHLYQQQQQLQQQQIEAEILKREQAQQKQKKQIEEQKLKQQEIQLAEEKAAQQAQQAQLIKHANAQKIQNISHLALGSWVELEINNQSKQCRLAAKIASTGKFIFVDRAGVKVKECFEKELSDMYNSGQIKLKQKNDVFDNALASVISQMRELK